MIRKFCKNDLDRVMQIWLEGNIEAHDFIEQEYWISNCSLVKEQILQADIYVYEMDKDIQGFVGMMDGYLAGIFVDKKYRSLGIGRQLLDFVKELYPRLTLNAYKKNKGAVKFYLREGFCITAENTDQETGEAEYTLSCKARPMRSI